MVGAARRKGTRSFSVRGGFAVHAPRCEAIASAGRAPPRENFRTIPSGTRRAVPKGLHLLLLGPVTALQAGGRPFFRIRASLSALERLRHSLGGPADLEDLLDQGAHGLSAPLLCDEPPAAAPLVDAVDPDRQAAFLQACLSKLKTLPYGDLRQFTTTIAMQDADAVRQALGAEQINIVGGSYGTRAVLEYQRQFPKTVRRAVIDGVAPPDMVLPMAMSTDN